MDIDADGWDDIRIYVNSNASIQCANYLYDSELETFKLLENCDLDIRKIQGINYFYSYQSIGCSDKNWVSYLSEIDNFKLISLGYMYGQSCDSNLKDHPQTISIEKITGNEQKSKLETLLYSNQIPRFEDKWDFILRYWTENYNKFIR